MKNLKTIAVVVFTLAINITGHSQSLKEIIAKEYWYSSNYLKPGDTINFQQSRIVQAGYLEFNTDSTVNKYVITWYSTIGNHACAPPTIGNHYNMFPMGNWSKIGTWEISNDHMILFFNNKRYDYKVAYVDTGRFTLVITKQTLN